MADNVQECRTYLDSAAQALPQVFRRRDIENAGQESIQTPSETGRPLTSASALLTTPDRVVAGIEVKALFHFCALLMWNDAISCFASRKAPAALDTYRMLLCTEDFLNEFRRIGVCEGWALGLLLDVLSLDVWKREMEAKGELSLRELLKRAASIEAEAKAGIRRLSGPGNLPQHPQVTMETRHDALSLRTNVMLHALLVDLQIMVSGGFVRAPEVKDSIEGAISAIRLRQSPDVRNSLAWAVLVVGSARTGDQRDIFRSLVREADLPILGEALIASWADLDAAQTRADGADCRTWRGTLPHVYRSVSVL